MGAFRARSRVAPRRISSGVISAPGVFSNLILSSPDSTPGRERFFEIARTGRKAHLPAFAVRGHSGDFGMMAEPIGSFENKEFLKISIKHCHESSATTMVRLTALT